MNLNNLDMRLQPRFDKCLLNFESFKFIKLLFDKYNKLDHVKNSHILNLKDSLFYSKYPKIYNFLSVLTLKRDYDDDELMFISNLIYKQKGSLEAIKQVLNLVKCEYKECYIDKNLDLYLTVSFEDVREIYLSSKYLQLLCYDLLFFDQYKVNIDSMSIRYSLNGSINKRYAIYTTYDLESTTWNTDLEYQSKDLSEPIHYNSVDELPDPVEEITYDKDGLKTIKTIKAEILENSTYVKKTVINKEEFKQLDTLTIDTYEW